MSPAEQFLKEIAYSYRSWSEYDDHGFVEYQRPDTGANSRLEFATHFRAPATFNCRFRSDTWDSDFELTRDGNGALVRRGDRNELYESFDLAAAALTGVSMGVVSAVPRLLFWKESSRWVITQLDEPSMLSPSEVDGQLCRRVQGTHPWQQLRVELVVDDSLHLIRRIIESMPYETETLKVFTTYFPQVVV